MQNIKRDSSEWINHEKLVMGHFSWQEGYGAFSYSKSQIPQVATYIDNQEKLLAGKMLCLAKYYKY
ncbi:hypothetical protein FACS1894181_08990 [Bacteroidia bacterium]|nr:hypothetical protein FACS1894181_08990 [Bacteroidia bacterium]